MNKSSLLILYDCFLSYGPSIMTAINHCYENRLKSPQWGGTTHPSLDVNAAGQ